MTEIDEVSCVPVDEFDAGTRIVSMSDGSVHLVLGLMPPSWWAGKNEALWESFHDRLEAAVRTPVQGEDKELFIIATPHADTVGKIRAFLVALREVAS